MKKLLLLAGFVLAAFLPSAAQRLTVGGYGEVALTRNVVEAIMWHGYSAVVKFIESI